MTYLTDAAIEAVEQALRRGERVELIPTKGGVKVMRLRREELKMLRPGADSRVPTQK